MSECQGLDCGAARDWHGGCECTMAEITALKAKAKIADEYYTGEATRSMAEEIASLRVKHDVARLELAAMRDLKNQIKAENQRLREALAEKK